jgi:hypothetical protein
VSSLPWGMLNGLIIRQQLATTSTSSTATAIFDLPDGSLGVVSPAAGSAFFTAPWYEPLYICPESGCGDGGPFQQVCLELVNVGEAASACAAQAKAKIERNPTRLHALTPDGKTDAYLRAGSDGILRLDGVSLVQMLCAYMSHRAVDHDRYHVLRPGLQQRHQSTGHLRRFRGRLWQSLG